MQSECRRKAIERIGKASSENSNAETGSNPKFQAFVLTGLLFSTPTAGGAIT